MSTCNPKAESSIHGDLGVSAESSADSSISSASPLQGLNNKQQEAVVWNDSPLLVLAGAGSGKTRVITRKISYLIQELGVAPWRILAMTFTNKAAGEMRERVEDLVGAEDAKQVTLRTFHSLGAWLLRVHANKLKLSPEFTIYDDEESLALLHSVFPKYRKSELKRYQRAISRCKDSFLSPHDCLSDIDEDPLLPELYQGYQSRLEAIGNVDFGDLIFRSIQLFREFPEAKSWFQNRFSFVLVDEYQDTNTAQYLLLKEMWREDNLLTVVGDDDQSIYRFRGAKVENILSFSKDFPNTHVVKLEQNYRSCQNILNAASAVISHNSGRMDKTMWSDAEQGALPTIAFVRNHYEEAEYCAALAKQYPLNTAILYRTNAQSLAFETLFTRMKIPYTIVGSLKFFEREEIKDAMALLKLVLNPKDEISLRRIITKLVSGVGEKSINTIIEVSLTDHDGNLIEAIAHVFAPKKRALKDMLLWYTKGLEDLENLLLPEMLHQIIYQSGLQEYHRRQDEQHKTHKEEILQEFVNISASYPKGREGLVEMLESLGLDPQQVGAELQDSATVGSPGATGSSDGITLITIHNTKGLEFDQVIITGMEDELFPGITDGFSSKDIDIEEERRLCYVAMTRARKNLFFTVSAERLIWGTPRKHHPSRFLQEIPEELVDVRGNVQGRSQGRGAVAGAGHSFSGQFGPRRTYGGGQSRGLYQRGPSTASAKPSFGRDPMKELPGLQKFQKKYGTTHGAADGRLSAHGGKEEQFTYALGDRVHHMSYGPGHVIEVKMHDGKEIVKVRFDTGKMTILIAEYSGLEKILDSI